MMMSKKSPCFMHLFQKNVVSLWRAFALHWHKHSWKEKTLVVYWVSETSKIHPPEDRQPVFVHSTDYCCCRGEARGGAQIPQ